MNRVRLRRRFLVAMGLSASAAACSKEPARLDAGSTNANATTNATTSATPSATPSSTASASAPTPIGRPTGGHGCGFDYKCVAFPSSKKCAPSLTEPKVEGVDLPRRTGDLVDEERKASIGEKGDCCYAFARAHCGGGRPFRGDDGPIVAPHVRRSDWTASLAASPGASDEALAARWLREASFEHASVASFAKATLELLALGAPADLLADASRAALDEIAHAQTFFSLAKRRGAPDLGPGPLSFDGARARAATTFATFVVDTFLDGCVAETTAGIEIRSAADDGDDVERAAVAAIADDEERHAELAWRMLAWGVGRGGEDARRALSEAIDRLDDGDVVVRDVVLPCARALLAAPAVIATKVSAHGDCNHSRT